MSIVFCCFSLEETNLYKDTADYIKSIVLGLGMSECEIKEFSNEADSGSVLGDILGAAIENSKK